MDLFDQNRKDVRSPLADRMRPRNLEELVGQEHLVGPGKILRKLIDSDQLVSLIFWGPPGSGKTTLAHIIANATNSYFVKYSAVTAGIADVKKVVKEGEERLKAYEQRTILFIDELHRFNKAQQDAFLPHVEKGTIILIGATTENPSFEIIAPLLSRSRVLTLYELTAEELKIVIERALEDGERGLEKFKPKLAPEASEFLVTSANGDARIALNGLELAVMMTKPDEKRERWITKEIIEEALQKKALRYDRAGEEHYNTISAFIKSLRGSDPNAALYYLARMLEAGEDPLFIARRMVIFASEDIGNADPQAIQVAVACKEAVDFVGLPEAQLNLAQAVTYLATAPKSNASLMGLMRAKKDVRETLNEPVPLRIRNAPTQLMKEWGFGKDYQYPHNFNGHYIPGETYLPDKLKGRKYYYPSEQGDEKRIKERMERLRKLSSSVKK